MAAVLVRDTVTRWFTQGGTEMRYQCREKGENETELHHGEMKLEERTVGKGVFPEQVRYSKRTVVGMVSRSSTRRSTREIKYTRFLQHEVSYHFQIRVFS